MPPNILSCLNLFCRFLFCHVTFDFTDVCALDNILLGLSCIWLRPDIGFSIVSFEKTYFLWTPKWGEKSVPKSSPFSTVLPSARTCGCQGTCSQRFYTTCDFFWRHATKNMGNVDLKMGCKIWTPFWGPPKCFFLSRPPKRGPDFRPHFEVHIARFFLAAWRWKRSSPSRMLVSRFVFFTPHCWNSFRLPLPLPLPFPLPFPLPLGGAPIGWGKSAS